MIDKDSPLSDADARRCLKLLKKPIEKLSPDELSFVLNAIADADPVGFQITLETVAEDRGFANMQEFYADCQRRVDRARQTN